MINLKSAVVFSEPRDGMLVENRKENEDSFLIPTKKDSGYLFGVADGLGSYLGALDASSFVCDFLKNKINFDHNYLKYDFSRDIKEQISNYLHSKDSSYSKAATTLSACFLDKSGLSLWHVGDCRIYIKKDRKFIQLTSDHTQYQKLLDKKIYTKKELDEKGFSKNTLTTAISLTINIEEDYIFFPMEELRREYGDNLSIVIMSDGAHHFWDLRRRFGEKTMEDIIKFSNALKRRIERFGAIDDYTVMAATFNVQDIGNMTVLPIAEWD